VRTKNQKYIATTLLNIPELLKVVQEWDDEIRAVLSPNAYWFAMLTPETAQIDTRVRHVTESRTSLATRNIKAWMDKNGLPYHSPHKFRHGHIQYGQALAKSIADYKAISLNVGHANMEITDQFYSNINDGEVKNRISKLGKNEKEKEQDDFALFQKFQNWLRSQE
jgi:integrase